MSAYCGSLPTCQRCHEATSSPQVTLVFKRYLAKNLDLLTNLDFFNFCIKFTLRRPRSLEAGFNLVNLRSSYCEDFSALTVEQNCVCLRYALLVLATLPQPRLAEMLLKSHLKKRRPASLCPALSCLPNATLHTLKLYYSSEAKASRPIRPSGRRRHTCEDGAKPSTQPEQCVQPYQTCVASQATAIAMPSNPTKPQRSRLCVLQHSIFIIIYSGLVAEFKNRSSMLTYEFSMFLL